VNAISSLKFERQSAEIHGIKSKKPPINTTKIHRYQELRGHYKRPEKAADNNKYS